MILVFLACVASTGGSRVSFDAVATGTAPVDGGVVRYQDGAWDVTLDEVKLSVGPAYLWSGQPLVTASLDWLIAPAYADVDHFEYGYLRGEVVEQAAVDALIPGDVAIGAGSGLGGEARSAELWLAPPVGDVATALDGATLRVAGVARNGTDEVPFAGALTIDDAAVDVDGGDTPQEQRKVRGIPFQAKIADGGLLRVGFDARRMLVGADFAALLDAPADAEGRHLLSRGTTAWNVWYYQVRQSGESGPWSVTWDAP